ncbi:ribosome biogenesis GTPase Der [Spelaeicoccus albus]|uniref:GTPase Der n=1 Tax=Spelaeicoccus albus TaxID=1280376 RepID=A0A7Z0D566_9MICO|nr:ribosome biogenesis GTPase Der [Spelaeicoccus albus]NYI69070.1 GTP-binding protein [Spelaeicoccus albus]
MSDREPSGESWDTPDDLAERVAATSPEDADARAESLRAGLADYQLEDDDLALLDAGETGAAEDTPSGPDPVVAIVGRPNVGKSTLVNRILGRREAVVEDNPGVTRDRVSYKAEWNGRPFTVVDTGGWESSAKGMAQRVAGQAEIAAELADAVVLVVDALVGITASDEGIVRMLRRTKKPVILAANKVDDERGELDAAALWSLGLGEPHPVSGMHGRGVADLLDITLETLPAVSAVAGDYEIGGPRRVALLGRPNVGKSSMLNKLVGSARVIVDDVAGTTRDPVDELVQLGGRQWRFVDTAGIRRRAHQASGADFYAALRTQTALEKAEVAVVLIDASETLSEQDTRILSTVIEAGRALVIAYNKWDLMEDERRHYLEREIEKDLVQMTWAPRVNVSAKTGWHADKLVPAMDTALESWDRRISTGRFNAFLGELVAAHPHPLRGGKQPRILFGTQASNRPPKFVLFTTGFLDPGYRRFIVRRLREAFGFAGTPVELTMRIREKRSKR